MARGPIFIGNDGPEIVDTNFWTSAWASTGIFFLSTNSGTIRLLMPRMQQPLLAEMRTAKTIILTRGEYQGYQDAVELLFDDNSDSPFALHIGPQQVDRIWPPSENGRALPFVVYLDGEKVWSTQAYLRRAKRLPCLEPWTG